MPAGRPWIFSFEVKFYPTEPSMLQEDLTRLVHVWNVVDAAVVVNYSLTAVSRPRALGNNDGSAPLWLV